MTKEEGSAAFVVARGEGVKTMSPVGMSGGEREREEGGKGTFFGQEQSSLLYWDLQMGYSPGLLCVLWRRPLTNVLL